MFDSQRELLDKIRLGEDTFLAYKEARFSGTQVTEPRRESLANEIAAFANSRGGVFVLGVEDRTREVVGLALDRLDTAERFAHELCQDSIDPLVAPIIERLWLPATTGEDVAVIKIDVPRSLFVHRSPGGYLHRVGSTKRPMSPEYLARLFQQRSQARLIRFDEQRVEAASFADLDTALIRRFHLPEVEEDLEIPARKLGMVAPTGDDLRPTVTGVLLGAPQPERWIPHAYIQAVAYRGRTVPEALESPWYQIDAADITGPLDVQVTAACHFVARNQQVRARKGPRPRGSPAVRHDRRVRGCRQCRRSSRLCDVREPNTSTPVLRPNRVVLAGRAGKHPHGRGLGLPAGKSQRNAGKSTGQMPCSFGDRRPRNPSNDIDGSPR